MTRHLKLELVFRLLCSVQVDMENIYFKLSNLKLKILKTEIIKTYFSGTCDTRWYLQQMQFVSSFERCRKMRTKLKLDSGKIWICWICIEYLKWQTAFF